ncbi:MAG: sulfotransferase family protein, partial [Woeseiaceae bacterium]
MHRPASMTDPAYEGTIVIGAPRSGTTLLRRILDGHPDVACPAETNVFSGCGRMLQSETIAEGLDVGMLSGLAFAGFAESAVLEALREFAFEFHRQYARKEGKRRWASKTAFDLFYLDAIEKLCGDHARFICLQRHGLDVACSLKDLCDTNGGYLSELHEYIRRYPSPLEAFC